MKIFRNITLLLLGLLLSQAAAAQTVLTGTVKDQRAGSPLPGANVYLVNANNRTIDGNVADINGQYRLKIPAETAGLSVVFSFVGYESYKVAYTSQKTINATLKDEERTIAKTTISAKRIDRDGMGLTPREVTSATQKITLESVETAPVTNIVDALQGTLSNVDILTGGDPGAGSQIRIRGTSSLNGSSEPLIVLDGIPFPVIVSNDFNFATASVEDFGQLLNISPSDLESIEVLKDAAASAIWGSRGANGVLLINSKRGQKGRIAVGASSRYSFLKESGTIPVLNGDQYVAMIQNAIWNTVNSKGQSYNDVNLLMNTKEIGFDRNWLYFDEYNQNTNWVDEITRNGYSFDNTVNVSGGGENTDYRLSMNYLDEVGTTKGTAFSRLNTTFKMGYSFSRKLKVTADFLFSQGTRDSNYDGDKISSPRDEALRKMPNMSPYVIGPDGQRTDQYFTPQSNIQGDYEKAKDDNKRYNPVALVNESMKRTIQNKNNISATVQYNILPGLDYTGTIGLNITVDKSRTYLPQAVTGVNWNSEFFNASSSGMSDTFYLFTDDKLVLNKSNKSHRLIAVAKLMTVDQTDSKYSMGVSGNTSTSMIDPISGGKITAKGVGSDKTVTRIMTGTFNVNYTLLDRYTLNGGYVVEGSSAMASNNRWGGFFNYGVAWQIGDEKFMSFAKPYLSMAKIRYSWGQIGNAPSKSTAYFGTYKAYDSYLTDPAIRPSSMQLNNLNWETITSTNIGLDVDMFDGRLSSTIDVYDKVTTDLLHPKIKVPGSTGYAQIEYFNSGKMTNKGWEFRINYNIVKTADHEIMIGFNISRNQNKMNELPSHLLDTDYTFGNGKYATKNVAGDPLGSFYGYKYQGVYQNEEDTYMRDANGKVVTTLGGQPVYMKNGDVRVYPGDAKYTDVNNDGVIDDYDIVYLGNANPSLLGGMQFKFRYKAWSILGNVNGRTGQKAINMARLKLESMYNADNQSTKVLERWRTEGDKTDIPRALYGYGFNALGSDRFVEDASFVRLNSLTLTYRVPAKFLIRHKLTQMDLFLTGWNLLTITKYKGQDPEINAKGNLAIDDVRTPKPIKIQGGINLNF